MIELAAGTQREATPLCNGRRLWSLWDIMQTFHPEYFIAVSNSLGSVQHDHSLRGKKEYTDKESRDRDIVGFKSYIKMFNELGFKLSKLQVDRAVKQISEENFTSENMVHICMELKNRMEDECISRHFFTITDEEEKYLDSIGSIFPKSVINKLPSASEDLDEAGKCLALGRYTACVFHLMRVMEIGVQEFGTKIGVKLADEKVWQVIIQEADKAIRAMDQKDAQTKKYASISAHLYNVKLAWRNEVMHPKATYTSEEAQRIILTVAGFLVDLIVVL